VEVLSGCLSEAFLQADDRQRRHAAVLACRIAVAQSGLDGKAVVAALAIVRNGGNEPAVRREIEALCADLDDAYLRLWDGTIPPRGRRRSVCSEGPGRRQPSLSL
jgi:hypothetical protein